MGTLAKLADTMHDAAFVLVDGVMFETEYLRVPDEDTPADDVVLEAKHGDTEIVLTCGEIDGAQPLGEGVYQLRSGAVAALLLAGHRALSRSRPGRRHRSTKSNSAASAPGSRPGAGASVNDSRSRSRPTDIDVGPPSPLT